MTQFYVTSTDGKSAEIWPLPEWEKREEQLADSSTMDDAVMKVPERDQLLRPAVVEMDNLRGSAAASPDFAQLRQARCRSQPFLAS